MKNKKKAKKKKCKCACVFINIIIEMNDYLSTNKYNMNIVNECVTDCCVQCKVPYLFT